MRVALICFLAWRCSLGWVVFVGVGGGDVYLLGFLVGCFGLWVCLCCGACSVVVGCGVLVVWFPFVGGEYVFGLGAVVLFRILFLLLMC